MTLVVEDGTGKFDAESYVSIADANAYAAARGFLFPIAGADAALAEQALRRATTWLDATYRGRFTGQRKNGRSQGLEWPRINAFDFQNPPEFIPSDEVPREIVAATCEAAVRELASSGSLSPDVTPGAVVKRERVEGAVEVEYATGGVQARDQRPIVSVVEDILGSLLGPARSPYFGRAVRA